MPVSDKQKAHSKKHIQEKLDEIKIRPPKGTKKRWATFAEAEGKSLQRFIIDIIEETVRPQDVSEDATGNKIKATMAKLLTNEKTTDE